jgi:hypothetical protein
MAGATFRSELFYQVRTGIDPAVCNDIQRIAERRRLFLPAGFLCLTQRRVSHSDWALVYRFLSVGASESERPYHAIKHPMLDRGTVKCQNADEAAQQMPSNLQGMDMSDGTRPCRLSPERDVSPSQMRLKHRIRM